LPITGCQSFTPANKKVKPDNTITAGIVKEVADKDYQLVNRIWEATPTEIIEAAVDEFGKFMVNPTTAKEVQGNLQTLAADYWSKH
jgi:multiple sugar transport system substrate-binding protein